MSDQENIQRNGSEETGSGNSINKQRGMHRHSSRSHHGNSSGWGWWEHRSLPQKILIGIGFGILGILFLGLLGLVVMVLWNWLMPEIFGLKRVDYWQAWGLLVLCTILFKSFGSDTSDNRKTRKRRRHLRNYMQEEQPAPGEDSGDSRQT